MMIESRIACRATPKCRIEINCDTIPSSLSGGRGRSARFDVYDVIVGFPCPLCICNIEASAKREARGNGDRF